MIALLLILYLEGLNNNNNSAANSNQILVRGTLFRLGVR